MNDFTIITCSYNTPIVTETLLKSWVYKHPIPKTNILIMENSTNDQTEQMLNHYGIPYVRNPGMTHSLAVDKALKICKQRYVLLVDTDVTFNKNVFPIIDKFISQGYTILGDKCGDRANYKLFPRIHPWFCLIDLEEINKQGISFHDQKRIDETNSNQFFSNVPNALDRSNRKYDVGATFYEDILNAGLKIGNGKFDPEWFVHHEGLSWYKNAGNAMLASAHEFRMKKYEEIRKSLVGIDIRGRFV